MHPIHNLIQNRRYELATRWINDNPEDISFQNEDNEHIFHMLAYQNDPLPPTKFLRFVLSIPWCKEGLIQKNFDGETPLHIAVFHSSVSILTLLLLACPKAAIEKNVDGRTPLHLCCLYGKVDIAKSIVKNCVKSVYVRDNNGRSPLAYASYCYNEHIPDIVVHKERSDQESQHIYPHISYHFQTMNRNN